MVFLTASFSFFPVFYYRFKSAVIVASKSAVSATAPASVILAKDRAYWPQFSLHDTPQWGNHEPAVIPGAGCAVWGKIPPGHELIEFIPDVLGKCRRGTICVHPPTDRQ